MRTALFLSLLLFPLAAFAQTAPPGYRANCQMCHQAGGKGVAGVYPRLAGRISEIAANAEGRVYLVNVLLYGQNGRIVVDGKPISGLMLPYARMSDAELADVLNYLVKLGVKAKPFTPAEIKAVRAGLKLTPAKVRAERERLVQAGVIK